MAAPYYLTTPAIGGRGLTARECANEFRYIARLMPASADADGRRRKALRARAAAIDAGQFIAARHFRVMVPAWRGARGRPGGKVAIMVLSYPCRGGQLYTFDEAWIFLEGQAARHAWPLPAGDRELECWAEGANQNMDLGIIYDGIAEPTREVPGTDLARESTLINAN